MIFQIKNTVYVWHVAAICIFIAAEITFTIAIGNKADLFLFVIFYTSDILYFYFNGHVYMPIVIRFSSHVYMYILYPVLGIGLYAGVLCTMSYLLRFLKYGNWMPITSADIALAAHRSFFIWTMSSGYWFARYSIAKAREVFEVKEREGKLQNDYVRSQVNPHFLFNTLTFIYYKLLPKNPEIAQTVSMLSEMMHYSIRNNREDSMASLSDEILQLQRYIDIQQTLNDHKLNLKFQTDIKDDGRQLYIPPLLFLNFVENIFKYGQLKNPEHPAMVKLSYKGNTLKFYSENYVRPSNQVGSSQIGLSNVRGRLSKYFNQKYSLQNGLSAGIYKVDLKINI